MSKRKLEAVWDEMKQKIREEFDLSVYAYLEWIEPLKIDKCEKDAVIIGVPHKGEYTLKYYYQKYRRPFQRAISEYLEKTIRVEFEYAEDDTDTQRRPARKERYQRVDLSCNHMELNLHIRQKNGREQVNAPLAMNRIDNEPDVEELPRLSINIYFD